MSGYHVLLSSDENYIMQAVVSINSIIVNNPGMDLEFHIMHSCISEQSTEMIEDWIKHKYSTVKITFHKIKEDDYVFPVKPGDAVSKETYFRILAANILSCAIPNVLYVDCDTITVGEIRTIFDINIDDKAAGCCSGYADEARKQSLGLTADDQYFQAGVMLMNLSYWREHGISEKVMEFIKENPDILPRWDQDALNAILKGQWLLIDQKWNTCLGGTVSTPRNMKFEQEPVILHYTGFHQLKPWLENTKSEWQDVWLKYTKGTPFENEELKWFYQTKEMDLYEFDVDDKIKRKVILYGAGAVGTDFYEQNKREEFCEVVAWVDKNYERYRNKIYHIESIEALKNNKYDYVYIAVLKAVTANEIEDELIKAGVDNSKIRWLSPKEIVR